MLDVYSDIIGLCEFLALLDQRYEQKVHKEGGQMAKKNRKIGSLSTSSPPVDAPSWTVDPDSLGTLKDR